MPIYGIRASANSGGGHLIQGNNFGGRAADGGGNPMTSYPNAGSFDYSITGISLTGSGSALHPVIVSKNHVLNISSVSVCGINVTSSSVATIDSNIVEKINISYVNVMQYMKGIGVDVTGSDVVVTNNSIRTINQLTSTLYLSPKIIGIASSGSGHFFIDNNLIDSLTSIWSSDNPNSIDLQTPIGISSALSNSVTGNKISNNRIKNITNTKYASVCGIYVNNSSTGSVNVFNNKIDSLFGLLNSTTSVAGNRLSGILEYGQGTDTFYNNIINIGSISFHSTHVYGIRHMGLANAYYYFNTVDINGPGYINDQFAGTTSAFCRTQGNAILRNNILINRKATPIPTVSYSYTRNFAILNTGSTGLNSDYNLLYTADSVLARWNSISTNFADWKAVSKNDTNSVNAQVTFSSSNDFHIDGSNVSAWNVFGRGIAIPSLGVDIEGNSRSVVVGSPVTIGAYEIPVPAAIPADMQMTPGTPVVGTPTVFTSAGKKIAEITWTGSVVPGVLSGKYYPGVVAPNPSTTLNSNSYFEITSDVTTGIPYTIKTYYTEAEAAGIPDAYLWGMKSHTPGVWTGTTSAYSNHIDNNGKYLQSDVLNDFSSFSMNGNGNITPLSIDLKTIAAINVGYRNKIEWATATETQADYFELESSVDAHNFKKIAKVVAKGQASVYSYWDENAASGTTYYRLKMTTDNGSYFYSKTVAATVKASSDLILNVYPNPVQHTVTIRIDGNVQDNAVFSLLDITGRVMQTVAVKKSETEMDLNKFSAGTYILKYSDDKQEQTIKITKQ